MVQTYVMHVENLQVSMTRNLIYFESTLFEEVHTGVIKIP